jgi:hypothetical protein
MDCPHTHTEVEILPTNQEHYAVVKCCACAKALCFKPHPHVLSRRQRNAANIKQLLGSNRLSQWEHGFLSGLIQHPRPTCQQQAQLALMVEKYLRKDTDNADAISHT